MPSNSMTVTVRVDATELLARLEKYAAHARKQKRSARRRALMQPTQRPEILPYIIAVIAVVGIILLQILGDRIPEVLNTIAMGAVVGGAAISRSSPPTPPA